MLGNIPGNILGSGKSIYTPGIHDIILLHTRALLRAPTLRELRRKNIVIWIIGWINNHGGEVDRWLVVNLRVLRYARRRIFFFFLRRCGFYFYVLAIVEDIGRSWTAVFSPSIFEWISHKYYTTERRRCTCCRRSRLAWRITVRTSGRKRAVSQKLNCVGF